MTTEQAKTKKKVYSKSWFTGKEWSNVFNFDGLARHCMGAVIFSSRLAQVMYTLKEDEAEKYPYVYATV